jgi:hypothetical protein
MPGTLRKHRLSDDLPTKTEPNATLASLKGFNAVTVAVRGVVSLNTPESFKAFLYAYASVAVTTVVAVVAVLPSLNVSPTSTIGAPLQELTFPLLSKSTLSFPTT